jgi:hypothetical protein
MQTYPTPAKGTPVIPPLAVELYGCLFVNMQTYPTHAKGTPVIPPLAVELYGCPPAKTF